VKKAAGNLYVQVLAAIAIGVIFGLADPAHAAAMKPLGDGFIKLVKMLITPIVFCTVVIGISQAGELKDVGRIGLRAIVYFEIVTTLALIIGLVVVNVLKPGAGLAFDPARADMKSIASRYWMAGWLLLATAGGAGHALAEDQISWTADFRTACGMAAEQHRLVLLHFYSDNCEWCVRLDQNVFSKSEVAEAVAQNYLAVKIHAGKQPQLASRYRVKAFPTDVFVTPSGLEVYRTVSQQKPATSSHRGRAVAASRRITP